MRTEPSLCLGPCYYLFFKPRASKFHKAHDSHENRARTAHISQRVSSVSGSVSMFVDSLMVWVCTFCGCHKVSHGLYRPTRFRCLRPFLWAPSSWIGLFRRPILPSSENVVQADDFLMRACQHESCCRRCSYVDSRSARPTITAHILFNSGT